MNKFKEYLEISKEVQFKMMKHLISEGLVKKHSDYNTLNDILFSYHNFPGGFSWNTMRSYLIIDTYKKGGQSLNDSTAKQWVNRKIQKMIDLGYATKENDLVDKRKIFINWTDKIKDLYQDISDLFKET